MNFFALAAALLLSGCFLFDRVLNDQVAAINNRIGQRYWPIEKLAYIQKFSGLGLRFSFVN